MNNQEKLQRRKAELAAQIEQQRLELKSTFIEIRQEIEPANLLKKAVSGALGFSKNTPEGAKTGFFSRMPAPVSFLVDVLVRDPKWAIGLKLLTPLVLKYWPNRDESKVPVSEETPAEAPSVSLKTKVYGKLLSGISSLRAQLRKAEKSPEKPLETPPETPPETIIEQPKN